MKAGMGARTAAEAAGKGPDMGAPVGPSAAWEPSPGGPGALLHDLTDLKSGDGTVPMVTRFPGFEPQHHVRSSADEDDEEGLAGASHVDAVILLAGEYFDPTGEDPLFDTHAGRMLARELARTSAEARGAAAAAEAAGAAAGAPGSGPPLIDAILVREMRRVPADGPGGSSNSHAVVQERCARLYRSYVRPPGREERIENLTRDALPFARVQAHNLSLPAPSRSRGPGPA